MLSRAFFLPVGARASVPRGRRAALLLYVSGPHRYFRPPSPDAAPTSGHASGAPASSHTENGACELNGVPLRLGDVLEVV